MAKYEQRSHAIPSVLYIKYARLGATTEDFRTDAKKYYIVTITLRTRETGSATQHNMPGLELHKRIGVCRWEGERDSMRVSDSVSKDIGEKVPGQKKVRRLSEKTCGAGISYAVGTGCG